MEHSCYTQECFVHCGTLLCYNCYRMHMLTMHGKGAYLHNRANWMTWDYELFPESEDYATSYNEDAAKANKLYYDWLLTTMTDAQLEEVLRLKILRK